MFIKQGKVWTGYFDFLNWMNAEWMQNDPKIVLRQDQESGFNFLVLALPLTSWLSEAEMANG